MKEGGTSEPQWLRWTRRLQAIARDGLTYSRDDYDLGRFEQLRELAAEMLAAHSTGTLEEARNLLVLETYKLVYLCELLAEERLTDVDADGARFFGEQEIPALSVTRITRAQISRYFAQHRDPSMPTEFD